MEIKQKPTIDFYRLTDIAIILSIIVFINFIIAKTKPIYCAIPTLLAAIFWIIQTQRPAEATNKSDLKAFAKDEKTSETKEFLHGQTAKNIDAIKVNDEVFKIPDGVHAVITDKGKIQVNSICGNIIYRVRGGKIKNRNWKSWQNLFNAE